MLIVLLFLKTGNSSSTRTAVESMHDAKSAQSCPTLCVQPCVTLWTVAHQAPLSVGFSRQEHWSGLPFPSPMHESEKWKWSRSVVYDSATPWTAAHQAPLSVGFSRQEYWSGVPLPNISEILYYTPVRTAKIQNTNNTKFWKGCGAIGTLIYCGGNAKC